MDSFMTLDQTFVEPGAVNMCPSTRISLSMVIRGATGQIHSRSADAKGSLTPLPDQFAPIITADGHGVAFCGSTAGLNLTTHDALFGHMIANGVWHPHRIDDGSKKAPQPAPAAADEMGFG
jgi:hypothetical protein